MSLLTGEALDQALARVTVVAVTYHSAHCVAAMAAGLQRFPHVVVVDNASTDDTLGQLAQHLPRAQVLRCERNLGFGAANNLALDQVRTPYALLLNPDCQIDPASAARLVQTAEAWPTAAIVAPQLLASDGGKELNYGWLRWLWAGRGPAAEGPLCVGHACAAAWLVRCDAARWRFDTGFFLYYEDEDLCARIFQARQMVLIEPQATAVHANRGSVRGRSPMRAEWGRGFHHSRSKIRFQAKHRGARAALRTRRKALWLGALEVLVRVPLLNPRLLARSAGRWWGMWTARAQADAGQPEGV
ncbi:MAG: glycosyltransferase family 2 protein [Acidovorax sp.]|uniref:glycosyltransferase family 2 protein n=1 Tax=Acidovorax sp. TaxID=1872122 RepID=UPI0039E5EBA3